jgi:hypothetical protein
MVFGADCMYTAKRREEGVFMFHGRFLFGTADVRGLDRSYSVIELLPRFIYNKVNDVTIRITTNTTKIVSII